MRCLWIGGFCLLSCLGNALAAARPNVLVILVDDMGFSDLGCYGGEISTPHLNSLAEHGLRWTQFYNTARCWPTRGALLTGYYAQQIRRDTVPGLRSGGRGVRPSWAPLLTTFLKPAGYRCYHSGKWHVDGMPVENGFDHSYYLRDQGRFFSPKVHFLDDEKLPAVERGSGYYATIAIADHAVKCLQEHAQQHSGEPFFHYLAFTAPHFPLHALPEDIHKYRETYRVGWDVIRQARWKRQQESGLWDGSQQLSQVEREIGPPYHFPEALEILGPGEVNRPIPWERLTDQQKKFQADKMAVHAAMVDRIDQEIGRVLQQLRKMQAWENTLILFLSDNGASAEIMVRADGHDPDASPGSASTHLCLGPGWSTACNTPFRRHKTWVHEGGCCTPLIAHWPSGIADPGGFRRTPGHVIDIAPTILELAGVTHPSRLEQQLVPPWPGRSLLPVLRNDSTAEPRTLWWLHEGNRAIRIGDWKLVAAKKEAWELFHLKRDRNETNNLAAKMPERVRDMSSQWEAMTRDFFERARQDAPPQGSRKPPGKGSQSR